jgi:hypothetical protein
MSNEWNELRTLGFHSHTHTHTHQKQQCLIKRYQGILFCCYFIISHEVMSNRESEWEREWLKCKRHCWWKWVLSTCEKRRKKERTTQHVDKEIRKQEKEKNVSRWWLQKDNVRTHLQQNNKNNNEKRDMTNKWKLGNYLTYYCRTQFAFYFSH